MLGIELTGANWVGIALIAAVYFSLLVTTLVFTADGRKKLSGWYKYVPVEDPVQLFYFERYITHQVGHQDVQV